MSVRWSRRSFLGGLAGLATAPLTAIACSSGERRDPEVDAKSPREHRADRFAFDLHAHPGAFYARGLPADAGGDGFFARVEDMAASGMTGAFFALVADVAILERTDSGIRVARAFEPGEAWADYRRQLEQLRELMARTAAREATELAGIDQIRERGEVAAVLAVEGGDFLEGDAARLAEAYQNGVRSIQLVHYAPNDLADLQTQPPTHGGLSAFGAEVVDGMVELGMVINVAHASFATVEAVAERAGAPVLLSHSLLNTPQRSHPRHIDEEHARVVADTGGVVGMWPSGFGSSTLDEFVEHTLRMVDLVGVDHVGLGTDMDGNYRPVIASYADALTWARALEARGLSGPEVSKLTGGNARRLLEAVL